MRIVSWNVAGLPNFLWGGQQRGVQQTPEYLRTLVHRTMPDVVCVQECFFRHHRERIGAKLVGYARADRRESRSVLNSGLETWVRLDHTILGCKQLHFAQCAAEDCAAKKGIQVTRIALRNGTQVSVYNVHMQNDQYRTTTAFGALRAQISQLRQLVGFIDCDESKHVVVTGDMNIHSGRLTFRRFLEIENLKRSARLKGDINDIENTWVRSSQFAVWSVYIPVHPHVSDHPIMFSWVIPPPSESVRGL